MVTRYIPHTESNVDWKSAKADIVRKLIRSVARVQKYTPDPDTRPSGSVYVGLTGTVLMNHHLATLPIGLYHSSLGTHDLLSRADMLLSQALSVKSHSLTPSHTSFLETSAGTSTLVLLSALEAPPSSKRDALARSCARSLLDATQTVVAEDGDLQSAGTIPDDGSETLYGRAGLLYCLLLLRSSLNRAFSARPDSTIVKRIEPLISDTTIRAIVYSLILRGKAGSANYAAEVSEGSVPPLMWSWHGKRYLGAAHGLAGILHILLLSPVQIIIPHMPDILNTVEWLLGCQDPDGNWPTKAVQLSSSPRRVHRHGVNDLVHWCHGAPGVLILLCTVLRLSSSSSVNDVVSVNLRDKIVTSLQLGASLVYTKGFLRKGVGLCHGVAGSVYALLAVSGALDPPLQDVSREPSYFMQALHLAHMATDYRALTSRGEMSNPDHPWSLYEGVGGMCCAWADVLYRMDNIEKGNNVRNPGCGMPGFDDLD